ncbi:alpha/beta fold hydrolase [Shewanella sp. NIFS-20-20]|uniref:alpha/beta fold hydrolase n=1 Tax=Shewanella sp. NIFS-20-20 TaxID=2853806 RepID=UPI001C4640DC|nr:alpha/beta hydrolase [Shewanella sp. NIFS-20-20]MBV7314414.1 alpha/beta hydrolase [Shewanella sp. NIFS-20-20]
MTALTWRAGARLHPLAVELVFSHSTLAGCYWPGHHGPSFSSAAKGKVLLIAVHGWLDNAYSFYPLAQCLEDIPLLAVDWPGHGLSPQRPPGYPLHFFDYISDLKQIVDYCSSQFEQVIVVGHSLGALVTSTYAAVATESLAGVILLEGLVPMAEPSRCAKQRLASSLSSHASPSEPKGYASVAALAAARSKLTGLSSQWSYLLVERNTVEYAGKFYWRTDPRLKKDSPWRMTPEQRQQLLANTDLPMLLVQGAQGYHQITSQLSFAADWFPRLEQVTLPGDHHFHMSAAEQLAARIREFITRQCQLAL